MLVLKHRIANTEGMFKKIHKSSLNIDPRYQREKTALVSKIVKEGWSWPRCGAINVSHREDGTLWVFDGGNRLRAANQLEQVTMLPCMIYDSDGYQEEAGTFTDVNSARVRVSGHDLQRSAVAAGSEAAIFVENLLRYSAERNMTPGRCEKILRESLASTVKGRNILRQIWPAVVNVHEGAPLCGPILRGLYWIEDHAKGHMSLHDLKWRGIVTKVGYNELLTATRKGALLKNSAPNWGKGILERINKGIPERLRLRAEE
jgi:hypothetical protein